MKKAKKHYGRWTESEYQYIKENYKRLSNKEMASELQRTPVSIANQRRLLGLDNWNYSKRPDSRQTTAKKKLSVNLGFAKFTLSR